MKSEGVYHQAKGLQIPKLMVRLFFWKFHLKFGDDSFSLFFNSGWYEPDRLL